MASARLDSETLPVITKHITQDVINTFEACGILNRANIHNDPELASKRLGTTYAIASRAHEHRLLHRGHAQVHRRR